MARVEYHKISSKDFDRILNGGWLSPVKMAGMTYNQLTRLVTSGRVSDKELRSTYSELRRAAKSRERTVSKESVQREFGNFDENNFRQVRNLPTTSELLHELADVGKFLRSQSSTITGLREQRQNIMDRMEQQGFEVTQDNYLDFLNFMKWFKASEYSKLYDSGSEEVSEVFNSGSTSPRDWARMFEEFGNRERVSPVVQY